MDGSENGKLQTQTTVLMHTEPQKHQRTSQSTEADIQSPNVTSHNAVLVSESCIYNHGETKRNNSFVIDIR